MVIYRLVLNGEREEDARCGRAKRAFSQAKKLAWADGTDCGHAGAPLSQHRPTFASPSAPSDDTFDLFYGEPETTSIPRNVGIRQVGLFVELDASTHAFSDRRSSTTHDHSPRTIEGLCRVRRLN